MNKPATDTFEGEYTSTAPTLSKEAELPQWKKEFRKDFCNVTDDGVVVAAKFGDGMVLWRQEAIEAFIDKQLIKKGLEDFQILMEEEQSAIQAERQRISVVIDKTELPGFSASEREFIKELFRRRLLKGNKE